MKHLFLISLIIPSLFLAGCKTKTTSIVGTYQCYVVTGTIMSKNYYTHVEFTNDGHVIFYPLFLKPRRGTYTIDPTKDLKQIDINLTLDDSNRRPDGFEDYWATGSHYIDGGELRYRYSSAGIYFFYKDGSLNLVLASGRYQANERPTDPTGGQRNYFTERCIPAPIPAKSQ
jgi:hypothetical protein